MVTSFSVISQMTYERDYNIVYCHFQIVSENLRQTKGVSLIQQRHASARGLFMESRIRPWFE